jgi:hypothetical protein
MAGYTERAGAKANLGELEYPGWGLLVPMC